MTGTVTLEQVEELMEHLSLQDQQRLIERVRERLAKRQEYFLRAEAFLKQCRENPVRPAVTMNSGRDLHAIREERGDQLL